MSLLVLFSAREITSTVILTLTRTPFHHIAAGGHLDMCKLIIENINDKNPANQDGLTPLHVAATCGHLDVFKLIIDKVIYVWLTI